MRESRGFPTLDDRGRIRIQSVNVLTYEELRNWIMAVLQGEDPAAGGDRGEMPHAFLERVYAQLDPHVRAAFEDAVLDHLAALAQDSESGWSGEPGDELLLLVAAVLCHSERRGAAEDLVRWIADQDRFRESPLHRRALQTLIGLGHRANVGFWFDQYQAGGESYASVVFAGLSLTSLASALEWAKERAAEDAVVRALVSRLPLLVEKHGADEVGRLLVGLPQLVPPERESEMRELAQRLGLVSLSSPQTSVFEDWTKRELAELVKATGVKAPARRKPACAWRRELEEAYREIAAIQGNLQRPTREAEVIVGITAALASDGEDPLPLPYRRRLLEAGQRVVDDTVVEGDAMVLQVSLSDMVTYRRDPKAELENVIDEYGRF